MEAIRSQIKKKSKIAKQLYVESSDEEDGPSAMLNEKMDRTTVSMQHAHFFMPLEDNSGNSERTIDTRLSRGQGRAGINNETGYSPSEILEDPIDQQRNVCNEHVCLTLMIN